MADQKWLTPGTPIKTVSMILKGSQNVRFRNPEKMTRPMLAIGTLGRIHSIEGGKTYIVWLYDEATHNTVILEIPLYMMAVLFKPHQHGLFPDVGR